MTQGHPVYILIEASLDLLYIFRSIADDELSWSD